MRILCILSVYNEMKYLPIKLEYCRQNGLKPYFIDNFSNDGTWEYLQEHNIPSHRFDTEGAFDLPAIQAEIIRTIHVLKPDWVVYNGCDLFPVTDKPLHDRIVELDELGFNVASMYCISFCNTGETSEKFNPFSTYFYFEPFMFLQMIHKYDENIKYCADHVEIPNAKVGRLGGVMINYGQTKTAEERNETLERRKKAWKNGMNPGHGSHYLQGQARNWTWSKEELVDVRTTQYWPYIQQLQKLIK